MSADVILLPVVQTVRPDPPESIFNVKANLSPDVYRAVVTYAWKNNISPSTVLAEAARAYLGLAE